MVGGDARGIYKTLNLDLRNYERLKMAVHAERVGYEECRDDENEINCGQGRLENGELTVFIRLGTDFVENYYEYEIPLTLSDYDSLLQRNLIPQPGQSASPEYVEEIWRSENNFDFPLSWLKEAKIARNNNGFRLDSIYSYFPEGLQDGHLVKLRGNPT
ncbi:MAG: hypothetical protein HC892_05565 [Saprospiraceae bacterium]|nr:hypothetical protein [Saprospiraceae bacterium]